MSRSYDGAAAAPLPAATSPTPPGQPPAPTAAAPLTGALITLLAAGAGLSAATLYYAQPLLGLLQDALGASQGEIGGVPTLLQLAYGLGLLLFAPLGDRHDRRRIILWKAGLLTGALLLAAAAPGIGTLWVACVAIGLTATLAQDLVPAAATLAPEAHRGRIVGQVMTGLFLGVLLSRVASGLVAEHWGWRTMFGLAALSIAGVGVAVWRRLPSFAPTTRLPYGALLGSLLTLWRQHPALRRAALVQGLLAVAFSAFWSTLAVMLHGAPFHLGSAAAGAFGLAGAAGAAIAPLAGRLADRVGPARVATGASLLVLLSFGALAAGPLLTGQPSLVGLAIGAVVFDLGVQAALIAHQTQIYGLEPAARSRLNAVLMVLMFTGMAVGAAAGSAALAHAGWSGVMALASAAALLACALRAWPLRG